ncbi:MAG: hypothetical protein PHQ52_01015 [Candidatus Omnitrophica bacterium]|nr:hypothetical protein [Candidatus Omnitrophota bacterium]
MIRSVKHTNNKGFSLAELLVVAGIGVFLVGVVMSVWFFVYRNSSAENIRTRNRVNLEIASEKIREDIRLSSATYMSGYPSGSTTYTGVSLCAATKDSNGFYTLSGGNIQWDKSIIYHLYNNTSTGNKELRKTVFSNNNSIIVNQTQREAQLASVVTNGDASSALNAANAVTEVLIPRTSTEKTKQNIDFTLTGEALGFNGYSSTTKRANVSFGSIELTPGLHEFKFSVTGKDVDSSGYKFGLDTLSIAPSGCAREPEIYNLYSDLIDTIFSSSGDSITLIGPDALWSGNFFMEYEASGVGSFLTFKLYNDVYRESNFLDAARDNAILTGDQLYMKLPDLSEGGVIVWQADEPTSASKQDYDAGSLENKSIRVILKNGNITDQGNLMRLRFDSYSTASLTIGNVFIDLKDDDSSVDPTKIKYDPSVAGELADYQTNHIQLFFTDPDTGDITSSTTIDPNDASHPRNVAYTNWAIYSMDMTKEYILTYQIIGADDNVSFWDNTTMSINSYLIDDGSSEYCDPVDPSKYVQWPSISYAADQNIYAFALVEIWKNAGSVTSRIYDTKQSDPAYNTVTWSEFVPSNSDVTVKVRESDDSSMITATNWGSISGFSSKPNSLSFLGTGRYLQFKADLVVNVNWTCKDHLTESISDTDYKTGVNTCSVCSEALVPRISVTNNYCPWIDNVTIDFPGENKVCEISSYVIQDNDYGIISLAIDGQDLKKGLEVSLSASEQILGQMYSDNITFSVEARNTGK